MYPSILHLVISLAPGGLERLVVDWTNARNHRYPGSTRICCLDELGELAEQVVGGGGGVYCVEAKRSRWPFDLAAVRRIVNSLRAPPCPPAILHAHNLAAWQYGVLAKLFGKRISPVWGGCPHPPRSGQPQEADEDIRPTTPSAPSTSYISRFTHSSLRLIYTQHGANVHNLGFRDRIRARLLACFTDEIVAVSDATAEAMAKAMWLPRKRIRVVANGVMGSLLRPARRDYGGHGGQGAGGRGQLTGVRERLAILDGAWVIGSVGRLAQVKGIDRLIGAFAGINRGGNGYGLSVIGNTNNQEPVTNNRGEAALLLVGDGPERPALEQQVRTLGIAERVVFAGYQTDPLPYLAVMDLFVLPSRSEGVSVALLEAMAAGIPVAVTDVGANREVIEDEKCGVILPENEQEWSKIMAAAVRDHDVTARKIKAAQERVRLHYSLETTLDAYEKLYHTCGVDVLIHLASPKVDEDIHPTNKQDGRP